MLFKVTIDNLGEIVNENLEVAFKYRGKVVVAPLQMVEDVLTIPNRAMNNHLNNLIKHKTIIVNLTLKNWVEK